MDQSFLYNTSSFIISICLILAMVILYYLGFRIKAKKAAKNPGQSDEGFGAIEGSLLGLLALLLSFTFGMSSSRHDSRFQVMIQEANAIGTAILRADLFPDSERVELRSHFKNYVEARIAQYDAGIDPEKNSLAAEQTGLHADSLWKIAVVAAKSENATVRNRGSMMVSSLNDMIDAVTTRKASRETTMPGLILDLLFLLCLTSSFIVGYGSKRKLDWIVASGFSVMIAITVFTILDLDRPHRGLINLDRAEQNMLELRGMLK
ncbi:bestrophin-like domain [Flavitalea flava]